MHTYTVHVTAGDRLGHWYFTCPNAARQQARNMAELLDSLGASAKVEVKDHNGDVIFEKFSH